MEVAPDPPFLRKLVLTLGAILGVALVLRLAEVLLLVFAAILVSVLLRSIAEPLGRRVRLNHSVSVALAAAFTAASILAAVWVLGRQVELQLASLAELLPAAWRGLEGRLSASPGGSILLNELRQLPSFQVMALAAASGYAVNLAGATAAAVIVSFAGLYLALHPATYLQGMLSLLPRPVRPRAAQVFSAADQALWRWLVGQLISMVLVGVTTGLGLWLVGAPSPAALGILAGVAQFIPVVGPMAAAIPGLVIGLAGGPTAFFLILMVYVGASQLEANLITPLVLRQMVELPMAVTLFAVLAMGLLLGPLGVLLATPLAVVAHVLVRTLYVEDVLGGQPMCADI